MTAGSKRLACLLALGTALSLSGCFNDEEQSAHGNPGDGNGTTAPPAPSPSPTNRAPTIQGTPPSTAKISLAYEFQPAASDADGDRLTFEIRGKPVWASFDEATGRLYGTPPEASAGTFTGIQILVSDGRSTAALPTFSIDVLEPVVGAAELAWDPPTANEDGSPLIDLASYVIRYGRTAGALDQVIRIQNPGTTMYVVENLVEGTWYFSLASVNSDGVESRPTGYVSKTIG